MRSVYEARAGEAREIERRICQGTDRIVSRMFGPVCKLLWPHKTAAHVAALGKRDERTAARWLSGEHEPPVIVVLGVMSKMLEPME